ncbi:MAG TPA: transcription termination factor NusA [Candidatus Akkermansia intestinigallinarum]|uniref:Transcription termination/antitermination protein NusA n=1 Tax=Candidatus Akkermansia intestinigallinarum TaxID=2838431 RepID=A0A9D1VAB5_9BACT|nr:transcription termination factor NusA [Candidatus Akkermansia intestinigallinarum]
MPTTDITALIDFYVREKDLTRERVIQALEASFLTAYSKMVAGADRIRNLRADINTQKGVVKIVATMTVVPDDELRDPFNEIKLSTAQAAAAKRGREVQAGDSFAVNITPKDFGRIAVQTARQTMQQRIRKAEQEMLAEAFRDRAGELVTGTVRRYDRGDVIVEVEKFEGIVPLRQRIPGEDYAPGDKMRFYVVEVRDGVRGTELILSRSHPNLVRRLFEHEVIEIAEHTVDIVNVVREAGYRTKLVVRANDPNVDPVGSCVGIRGMRVKNVVNELNHEKVDIIEDSDDKVSMVTQSLSPVDPVNVIVDEQKHVVTVQVESEKDAAKAKGRKGQNVRLTGRLISSPNDRWEVRVETYDEQAKANAAAREGTDELAAKLGVSAELAAAMVAAGFTTVQGIAAYVQPEDLVEALSVSEQEAHSIIEKAKAAC